MRLGGDEFCVYAVGINQQEMGESIISRLFERIGSLQIPEIPRGMISVSAGAVLHAGGQETTFADLYSCADSAMYESKQTSGNSLTFKSL